MAFKDIDSASAPFVSDVLRPIADYGGVTIDIHGRTELVILSFK